MTAVEPARANGSRTQTSASYRLSAKMVVARISASSASAPSKSQACPRSNGRLLDFLTHQRSRIFWYSARLCFARLPRPYLFPDLFFNRLCTVLMRTNDSAVDHGVLVVSITSQVGEHRAPNTALRPAAEPPMHVLPVTKPFR